MKWTDAPVWALTLGGDKLIARDVVPAALAHEPVNTDALYLVVAAAFPDPHTCLALSNRLASDGARRVAVMMSPPQDRGFLDALAPGTLVVHPEESDALLAWRVERAPTGQRPAGSPPFTDIGH